MLDHDDTQARRRVTASLRVTVLRRAPATFASPPPEAKPPSPSHHHDDRLDRAVPVTPADSARLRGLAKSPPTGKSAASGAATARPCHSLRHLSDSGWAAPQAGPSLRRSSRPKGSCALAALRLGLKQSLAR
eukprot:3650884-Rhodomonas_salina.2